MRIRLALFALVLAAFGAPALAGKAHEHGVATLDVGVEPRRVTFQLAMPLDSLVGFERAPRTDAERHAADAALAKLRAGTGLFRIDSAAGCSFTKAEVDAGALAPGAAAPAGGHGDVDASFEFACQDGHKAASVEVGLFEAFARLQRVEVQAVTRKGQMKATLKRGSSRLPLAR